jgi:hypothetical protein
MLFDRVLPDHLFEIDAGLGRRTPVALDAILLEDGARRRGPMIRDPVNRYSSEQRGGGQANRKTEKNLSAPNPMAPASRTMRDTHFQGLTAATAHSI